MTCEVHQVEATAIRPVIEGVMRRRFGSVEVDLVDDGTAIVATVVPRPVDPVKLQLEHNAGDVVVLDVLAPFPVRVDKATNLVLPDVVPLPADAWPLVAGLRVRQGGEEFVIVDVSSGRVSLRDPACPPLARPVGVAPSNGGVAFLVGLGVVAVAAITAVFIGRRT